MPRRIDFTGKHYGHLTIISMTKKVKGVRARTWDAACSACGGKGEIPHAALSASAVTSCGCRPQLSLAGFNLVARMRASGQRLCKSLPSSDFEVANPEIRFFLEPSGKLVSRDAAEGAIAAHELNPLGDGLFADQSQTWVAT